MSFKQFYYYHLLTSVLAFLSLAICTNIVSEGARTLSLFGDSLLTGLCLFLAAKYIDPDPLMTERELTSAVPRSDNFLVGLTLWIPCFLAGFSIIALLGMSASPNTVEWIVLALAGQVGTNVEKVLANTAK